MAYQTYRIVWVSKPLAAKIDKICEILLRQNRKQGPFAKHPAKNKTETETN